MNTETPQGDRFKQAMFPALLMGVATNIYISIVLLLVDVYYVLPSPLIGTVIFVVLFLLLNKDKITAKHTFLLSSLVVTIEVVIHTHFLGWHSGFVFFMFLLPVVFLLNADWKTWQMVLFNLSIAGVVGFIRLEYHEDGVHLISTQAESYISMCNVLGTGVVVIVVMLYFSRTIHKKDEELIRSNAVLELKNKEISKQHDHLQLLVKEIHHRVKNNLQIISSLISLQKNTIEDTEIEKVLLESRRRVEAIALIHQKLYQDDNANKVNFKSYLEELIDNQKEAYTNNECRLDSDEVTLGLDVAVPLGLIVSEMIINSIKHAFSGVDSPLLTVTLRKEKEGFILKLQDNGCGLPEKFSLENPISLGTEIIGALSEQIDATVEFKNDSGAQFIIQFMDK